MIHCHIKVKELTLCGASVASNSTSSHGWYYWLCESKSTRVWWPVSGMMFIPNALKIG